MKKNFLIKNNWIGIFDRLSNEQAGKLIKMLGHYNVDGCTHDCDDEVVNAYFHVMSLDCDAYNESYDRRCETSRSNGVKGAEFGKMGGRPKTPNKPLITPNNPYDIQSKPLITPNKTPNKPLIQQKPLITPDNDNDNDNDNESVLTRAHDFDFHSESENPNRSVSENRYQVGDDPCKMTGCVPSNNEEFHGSPYEEVVWYWNFKVPHSKRVTMVPYTDLIATPSIARNFTDRFYEHGGDVEKIMDAIDCIDNAEFWYGQRLGFGTFIGEKNFSKFLNREWGMFKKPERKYA